MASAALPTAKVSFPPRTKAAAPAVASSQPARLVASSPGFAVNDQVEYLSTTLKQWIPAIVIQVNGPHIMIDQKPGQWLGPADIQAKIRRAPSALANPMGLRVGDRVFYFSASQNKNFLVWVTAISPETGDIMIDAKPGSWISLEEQKERVQLPRGHPAAEKVSPAVVKEVPRCSKGHPLIFTGNSKEFWCCNSVKEGGCKGGMSFDQKSLKDSTQIPRFQCKYPDCDYDLCAPCAVSRTLPPDAVNPATCPKGHTLVSKGSGKSGWICDMVAAGKCLNSHITDYNMTAGLVRYTCIAGCNFDLCEQCYKAGFQSSGAGSALEKKLYCPALHAMTFCGKKESEGGWICGAARESAGCASGICEPVQPGLYARYACPAGCDFSLCQKCAAPRFVQASSTIEPAGPKITFKAPKKEIEEPEAPSPSSEMPIGSIVLDPENHLTELPQEVFSGQHEHPLKLKIATEANPMNIWKRFVVNGNTCDICQTPGHTNYYRCVFECRWYMCLECAKHAATISGPEGSTAGGAPSSDGKPRFEDLTVLQQDFYRQLEKVVSNDFKGDLGVVSPSRILAKYDKNKDESIDREEMENVVGFIYKNIALEVPGGKGQMVEMIFASHGLNTTDMVSKDDFAQIYKRVCQRALSSFSALSKEDLAKRAKGAFRQKYELGKRLSAGVGGVTYLATNKKNGATVVVKRPFNIVKVEDFDLLKDKSHVNLVRVWDLFTSQTETFIVMECCAGGDLFGAIDHCFENFGAMSYNFIAGVIQQALAGTNYLHKEFFQCHNDLKPENVLLETKPKSLGDVPRAMIADFGEVSSQNSRGLGDPRYRAPEVMAAEMHKTGSSIASADSDVWGLGIMFFELLSGGNLPFVKHRNLANWDTFCKYRNGELVQAYIHALVRPDIHPDYTEIAAAGPYAVDLCKSLLAFNRSDRIQIPKALVHPYFDIVKADLKPLDAKLGEVLKRRGDLSSMKIALLNYVASKMQGTSLDIFWHMWQQFDFKNEGVLKADAFTKMLVEKLNIPQAKAMGIFELADVDSSGAVDFNEFCGVLFDPTYMDSEQLESHLERVFRDLADADGKLDFRTFDSIFPASHSRSVLQSVFSEMDQDRDGAIEWEEFKNCVESM